MGIDKNSGLSESQNGKELFIGSAVHSVSTWQTEEDHPVYFLPRLKGERYFLGQPQAVFQLLRREKRIYVCTHVYLL